jgi:hypothetical protein
MTIAPACALLRSIAAFSSRNARYCSLLSMARARSRLLRRANAHDVLDDLAAAVDDHAPAPGFAAQPGLLREFHALLANIMITGETEDLAHHVATGQ